MRRTVNTCIRLSLIGFLFMGTTGLGVNTTNAYAGKNFSFAAGNSASLSVTPFVQPPLPPNVTADDIANTITGANAKMEYSSDGGVIWTAYDPDNPPVFYGAVTVQVRVIADSSNYIPSGFIKTLIFTPDLSVPPAPPVTADDTTNTITGASAKMEYSADDGVNWIAYDPGNPPVFTGAVTVQVRVAGNSSISALAGAVKTLTFTPNPPAPAAPAVSADDAANTITGADAKMEYSVDDGVTWAAYNPGNPPVFTGAATVKVRVASDPGTGTPAGAETALSFTTNVPIPAEPTPVPTPTTVPTPTPVQTPTPEQTPAAVVTPEPASTPEQPAAPTPEPAAPTPEPAAPLPGGISTPALTATPAPTPTASPAAAATPDIAGSATTSMINNQSVITVKVDEQKLDQKLAAEGLNAVISIPFNTSSDIVIGELSGRMLQSMEQKQAVIEIKTDKATYTIPAQQINISSLIGQLGSPAELQDINIQLEIAAPAMSTVSRIERAAQKDNFSIVVPSVDFIIRAIHGARTIEVTKFDAYVERTLAIPDGVDPNRITTGIVVDPDGKVRQVPTKVVIIGGKAFARMNSLTNSTYSVVYHPLEFADMAQHWAKTEVNDMGARMVVNGSGKDLFNPDQAITRAEFASIIVRGLGLKLVDGATSFSDVRSTDWYSGAIETLVEYKLIDGFEDGSFRPMDTITREQAMKIIAQAMVLTDLKSKRSVTPDADALKSFADGNTAGEWAQASIADVLESGIVSGRSRTTLAPKADISRAEAAVMIRRLLEQSDLI